ncbi:MAG TPA: DUF2147 domain-containing protein [Lunatimonas sp.]|nr:DUF2147 domain-containing protein [Lunatimonas sp.]
MNLNKLMLIALVLGFIPFMSQAQHSDAILGKWHTQEKDAEVEIFKEGDVYHGKMVWLKEPTEDGKPKVDKNNTDKAKRNRTILGMRLLSDFVHDGETWEGGTIYDPRNGKSYSSMIKLVDNDTMEVRGYVGIAAFGQTVQWTRVN